MFRGYIIYGEILLDNDLYLNAFSWFRFFPETIRVCSSIFGKKQFPKKWDFFGALSGEECVAKKKLYEIEYFDFFNNK